MKTINYLKNNQKYLFKKISSYPPIVKANVINSKFSLGSLNEKIYFNTLTVKHGKIDSLAYIFENTAYISDSNDMSIIKEKKLNNLKYLIIDSLKFKKHPSHFNLDDALYIFKILRPKKMILTNLHHDLDYNYLLKNLPKNIVPAHDGLSLNL